MFAIIILKYYNVLPWRIADCNSSLSLLFINNLAAISPNRDMSFCNDIGTYEYLIPNQVFILLDGVAALSELFSHYMEAWKSWYVEIAGGQPIRQLA
ncbi:hypothetical protein IFM89_018557 [Coptis chinensis]|uniref:Uncharacterized protein n=1 Tax=Coptis chinensis TaxID=261450 RepID=A0A835IDI8_9MAGN|nr:hypothetical protein IFM89_018557 [Coptis chinensis]